MNAHKLVATLSENGKLVLTDLPFQAGDAVEIIILEQSPSQPATPVSPADYPLQGTVLRYDDPFEPAVPAEDWEVLL